jgi:predicted ArsR family transcriptional regulator
MMMLNRLLELLQSGGTHRVADLARELQTTPELVEMMLEDLCRMGYLKRAGGGCDETCAACPMAGLCAAGGNGQVWTLTEKGEGADAVVS